MSAEIQIKQRAILIANRIKKHSELCSERVSSFTPEIDGNLQCPRCWVTKETRTALTPKQGDEHKDVFQCGVCQFSMSGLAK